ncbi:HD domain-containing protein [uncultured Bifidobacterium sp.]|uniref:HD domain-containing protein n=1 Tax=uncultured Bifidobacterium sp. TaxID=165187 RepID=UPI0028DC1600|nr:HD domain-containing protein [uncultured Bifidobacterium sp.]
MTGIIPTVDQVDELHRRICPSEAAWDLIHTHCVIVATIARQLARRRNALFMRRCTLPPDASEWGGRHAVTCAADDASGDGRMGVDDGVSASEASPQDVEGLHSPTEGFLVPPTGGVTGGTIPPRLIDEHLVVIGGLLHDIGTYRVLSSDGSEGGPLRFDGSRYIRHGLLGYEYLLEQGVDESIAEFARNHTGVGLTKERVEAQGLALPPADYVPVNLEQETVMVADKYHSKSVPPRFLTAEAYARKAARFGEDNRGQWLELVAAYGEPDVDDMARRFDMTLSR